MLQPFGWQRALWLSVVGTLTMSALMLVGGYNIHTHQLVEGIHVPLMLLHNLAACLAMFYFSFWMARRGMSRLVTLVVCLLGSELIGCLMACLFVGAENLIYGELYRRKLTVTLLSDSTMSIVSTMLVMHIQNITREQQMAVNIEHLQSENLAIRYRTLEKQISPHYLFNTLGTLDGLIGYDDNRAHTYLHQLADTFRYTLANHSEVTLREEMDFTHEYVDMMRVRYGEGLQVDEQIDAEALSLTVVPISVQLLVENAIKHNVVSTRHPLHISISTTAADTLRVSNPLQPKQDQEQTVGVGLDNLDGRYNLLFGQHISIEQTNGHFVVELPLIRKQVSAQ